MSYEPFQSNFPPYMYRILTPLLVSLLPFDHLDGFIMINLLAIFLSGILFYFFLKKLNFNHKISAIGVLLFLLSPGVILSIDDICLTDPVSFLFMIIAFFSILSNNNTLYFLSLSVGMLNRETVLVTLPLFFISTIDVSRLYESLKSAIIVTTLSILEFVGIRMYLGSHSFLKYLASTSSAVTNLLIHYSTSLNLFYIPYSIYWPFSTLWIMGFMKFLDIKNDFIKRSAILLPFIFIQMLIASDISRMVFIAFPIIIPMSLYLFADNLKIPNILMLILISASFLAISFLIGIHYFTTYFLVIYNLQSILIIILLTYILTTKIFNSKNIIST